MRPSNRKPCHGQCGNAICDYVAPSQCALDMHRLGFGKHLWNAVSLDRIDNTLPHFPDLKNPCANIRFVMSGLNTSANVTSHGDRTCALFREKMRDASDEAGMVFVNRMQKSRGKDGRKTCVYTSCDSASKQDRKRGEKVSAKDIFLQGKQVLCQQSGRCAVSGIVFEDRGPFQASLDAVNPTKPHSGNLRWVCACLNRVDHSRSKTYEDETSTAWTPHRFYLYLGLKRRRE